MHPRANLSARSARARLTRTRAAAVALPESLEGRALLSVIYVDDTAAGPARDGATWSTAYTDLQAALNAAAGTAGADEIRVAAGTYRPSRRTDAADPRSATFSLLNNVSLLGGYPDGGGTRNPAADVTTLSGDLGVRGPAADNSYHVVTAVGAPILDGFTVTGGNATGGGGGGMFNNAGSSPTVTNCTFTGNRAGQGGGVYNAGGTWSGEGDSGAGAAPTFFNCSFVRNAADDGGGGMYNAGGGSRGDGASATLTNCSFNGNSAGFGGGVLVNGGEGDDSDGASATLTNCTFVANTASDYGGGLITVGGERGVSGGGGAGLINCTLVANAAHGGGGTFMSALSGLGIFNTILWGNRAADDSRRAQIADDAEYNDPGVGHSLVQGGWEGDGNLDADPLFVRSPAPGADGDWGTADDDYGDLRLRPGSPAIDAGDTAAVPAGVTTDLAGNPRVQGSAVDMGAYELQQAVIYVDDTASGPARDGTSWATAYNDLQAALDAAAATAGGDEIRVAAGTYRPSRRTDAADPRSATFSLRNDVSIVGGYPDGGGANRDPAANVTTLSGDIGTRGSAADNSYHVVTSVGVGATARLDGFTVSGGNANKFSDPRGRGGGMYNVGGSSPTLVNCTFAGNSAFEGGGMYNADGSSPALTNCTLSGNSAEFEGGGMLNVGSSPTLTNCTIAGNGTDLGSGGGGGVYNSASSPTLTNCTIADNIAADGGGVYNSASSPTLTNCVLRDNRAEFFNGGGMYNWASSPTLTNCTISGNEAFTPGPGINGSGGGVYNGGGSFPTLANCILWGNVAEEQGASIEDSGDSFGNDRTTAHHSLVQGGWPGAGNLDADPLFAGDLRLRPGSPAIDAGDTAAVPAGVTTDLAGNPRVQGSAVDMGAYESEPLAATRYEAEQASITEAVVAANHGGFTGSGFVDFSHPAGDAVEFAVDAPAAGAYELAFRYANAGTGTRTTDLYVNGARMPQGVAFARTASWSDWAVQRVTVALTAGANTVRLQTSGQNGPNLDSLSVRLVTPQEAVTYQAEQAMLSGAVVALNVPGYTGSGFADYQHGSGDSVEFAVEVPAAGTYALGFRYANGGTSDRPLELKVDGQVLTGRLSFAPTGSWRTWKDVTRTAVLAAGRHLVRLTTAGSNGPNLDALVVSPTATPPPPVEPVTLQAEAASLSGPTVASNLPGYTGTGFADYQHAKGDSVEFTYTAPRAGDYVLGFRYANGSNSDRPLELKVNGAVALRSQSFAPTGSWRTWGLASPTVALAAGVNRIRLTSTGSNGPNLDSLTVQSAYGAVYLSQARSVFGFLLERYSAWDPHLGDVKIAVDDSDTAAAPDFGEFDGSVAVTVDDPGEPDYGDLSGVASATQHSRLTDAGISVAGVFDAYNETGYGELRVSSDADVTFELAAPRAYTLTYAESVTFTAGHLATRVALEEVGGGREFEIDSPATLTGTLDAGRYRFVFHHGDASGEVEGGSSRGTYSAELILSE
jgi:hypothetical protein